jgi:hypothetical protein
MHRGSCLCGSVRYEIDGEIGPLVFCHCRNCRKANASAFNSAAPVATDNFRLVSGREALGEFESSPGVYRVFCRGCGAPLFSRRTAMPETLRLRIGTLDTPFPGKPTAHIFTAEKAEWLEICDDLPQHPERPSP